MINRGKFLIMRYWLFVVFVCVFSAITTYFVLHVWEHGEGGGQKRCETIGAKYIFGRDFDVCIKPDGSMWKVP